MYNDFEPQFNASVHLSPVNVDAIEKVQLRDACSDHQFPEGTPDFGFTMPFKILPESTVDLLTKIIEKEREAGETVQNTSRINECVRGIAYRSKFFRELTTSPELAEIASRLAGMPLAHHTMVSNWGHTNVGHPPKETDGFARPVDCWHLDSVPFVMVILLSDQSEAVGGDLEMCLLPKDKALTAVDTASKAALEAGRPDATADFLPPQRVRKVRFPGPGYCIFMQGCEILHHVTPLLKAKHNRITLVQSFLPQNPWAREDTQWQTFSEGPKRGVQAAAYEFAQHKSWRLGSQLLDYQNRVNFSKNPEEITAELRRIASELGHTADLLEGKKKAEKLYVLDDKRILEEEERDKDDEKPVLARL
jgi:hypothetical protein